MTLKELEYFYKLCKNPHVTSVAKELNISQSAVSLSIKSLENSLGEKLFDRVGKRLILNERGRYFKDLTYKHYEAIVSSRKIFRSNLLAGELKVASSKTIATYISPQIYYKFLSQNDKVDLEISTLNSSDIIEKVLSSKIDIGLIETNSHDANLIKERLLEDELIAVTGDEKQKSPVYIDSLQKKWILRESGSGTREIFTEELGVLANDIKPFLELKEVEEIKSILLKYPDTISPISKIAVLEELKNASLFHIKLKNITFKRGFYLIYRRDKTKSALFDFFCDFVKKEFSSYPTIL